MQQMLEEVGIRLPTYKVRDIVQDLRNKGETDDELLSKPAFEKVITVCTISMSYIVQFLVLPHNLFWKLKEKGQNYGFV